MIPSFVANVRYALAVRSVVPGSFARTSFWKSSTVLFFKNASATTIFSLSDQCVRAVGLMGGVPFVVVMGVVNSSVVVAPSTDLVVAGHDSYAPK